MNYKALIYGIDKQNEAPLKGILNKFSYNYDMPKEDDDALKMIIKK